MKITIYTDGSSRGNPGPGGWAAVLLIDGQMDMREDRAEGEMREGRDAEVIELGGRENLTTNNRMELMGAIKGLAEIDGRHSHIQTVEVCTDSQYVKKGMSEWINGWIKKGWKNSQKKDVLNRDLWEMLKKEEDRLQAGKVKVIWTYVPAHVGVVMNERADTIATMCADDANDLQLYRGPKSDYIV